MSKSAKVIFLERWGLMKKWVERARLKGGLADTYEGKRRFERIRYPAHAELRITTEDGERSIPIVMQDMSLGGLGFMSREAIPVGTAAQVRIAEHPEQIEGEVSHCTKIRGGFAVGLCVLPDAS